MMSSHTTVARWTGLSGVFPGHTKAGVSRSSDEKRDMYYEHTRHDQMRGGNIFFCHLSFQSIFESQKPSLEDLFKAVSCLYFEGEVERGEEEEEKVKFSHIALSSSPVSFLLAIRRKDKLFPFPSSQWNLLLFLFGPPRQLSREKKVF